MKKQGDKEGYKKWKKFYMSKMQKYGFIHLISSRPVKTTVVMTTESNDCKTPGHPEKVIAPANQT